MSAPGTTVEVTPEAEAEQQTLEGHECPDDPIKGFCLGITETRRKLIAIARTDGRSHFGAEDVAHECFRRALEVREGRAGTDKAVRCLCRLAMHQVKWVLHRQGRRRERGRQVDLQFLRELEVEGHCALPDDRFLLNMVCKAVSESRREYTKMTVEEVKYGGTTIPRQRKSQELQALRKDIKRLLAAYGPSARLRRSVSPGCPTPRRGAT